MSVRKQQPWKNQLSALKRMGFKLPDNVLLKNIQHCDGDFSLVIKNLSKQMKNAKIEIKPQPSMVNKAKSKVEKKQEIQQYEWWLFPLLFTIIIPVLTSIFMQHSIDSSVLEHHQHNNTHSVYLYESDETAPYHLDNDILSWLLKQLINDKQVDNEKANVFICYLYSVQHITNSYDLVIFREGLLNNDHQMKRGLMKAMRFKNAKEMDLFIDNTQIYFYEMPSWIIGRYECRKYNNSTHHNGYHYVEIVHDRQHIGNYIWKTKIGQIWSLLKVDSDVLVFDVGKDCGYYNVSGYQQMSFEMDPITYEIHTAKGPYFEPYIKQSEL